MQQFARIAQNLSIHGVGCECVWVLLQMIELFILYAAACRLQTFMIPGSIIVNILAGSMYSLPGGCQDGG